MNRSLVAGRILPLLLFTLRTTGAGQDGFWNPIDTVTFGSWIDAHPFLIHHSTDWIGGSRDRWMFFDRRNEAESRIEARRFRAATHAWDTTTILISTTSAADSQQYPTYAESIWWPGFRQVVAWQQWSGERWQVFTSLGIAAPGPLEPEQWSSPRLLALDTLDQKLPYVVLLRDSTFLIVYVRGNDIYGALLTPSSTAEPKILAIGDGSPIDFDLCGAGAPRELLWSTEESRKNSQVFFRTLDLIDPFAESVIDTFSTPFPQSNPHLIVGPYMPGFLSEGIVDGGEREIWFNARFSQAENISLDPGGSDGNPHGFIVPVITKSGFVPTFDALVFEKVRPGDTSLVFLSGGRSDTVRSAGRNRNACVGTQVQRAAPGTDEILVVWESDRSGASHIYGRRIWVSPSGIAPAPELPAALVLFPNYPNPFNPATTISFRLARETDVRLDVVDLTGRVVATLQDGRESAGEHRAAFDGSACGSGVYFCRLRAGETTIVRPMLLLR